MAKFPLPIPNTLDEALISLERNLSAEDIQFIKNQKDENHMALLHHSLGQFLRNNWKLWHDSVLAEYFNGIGLRHADDMSGMILTSLWRKLNSQPLLVDEQVKKYQDFWNKNGGMQ